jgi:hypothetical protein
MRLGGGGGICGPIKRLRYSESGGEGDVQLNSMSTVATYSEGGRSRLRRTDVEDRKTEQDKEVECFERKVNEYV